MRNPWTSLPNQKPYALASDKALLDSFNAKAPERYRFDLSLLPEPFFGVSTAPVVVLNLNPGLHPDDAAAHANRDFANRSRRSLAHALHRYPFLHLHPHSRTAGANWWRLRTRELIQDLDIEQVANHLACVQFFPYHSSKYSGSTPRVPSQEYSFYLVRQAILRGAEIVIMRSQKLWLTAVPELANYSRLHLGSNPRASFISRGNLKASYGVVLERLRGAAQQPVISEPIRAALTGCSQHR